VPLALVKKLKWDITYKTIDDACAYAWALHKVQFKRTHCHTIACVNSVRLHDNHNCMNQYEEVSKSLTLKSSPKCLFKPRIIWGNHVFSVKKKNISKRPRR
jgi:hypothetical protein